MSDHDDLDEPFDVLLTDAAGEETSGVIRVVGAGSGPFLKIKNAQKWALFTATKRSGVYELRVPADEEAQRDAFEVLAACTVSWNLSDKGSVLECTRENAIAVYTRCPLIRDQVYEAIHGREFGMEDEMRHGFLEPEAAGAPQQEKRRRYAGPNLELARGDFDAAERAFRKQAEKMIPWMRRDGSEIPVWDGMPAKALLFPLAAGLGDMLLALRYLRSIARMCEHVKVIAPAPLLTLVREFAPTGVTVYETKDAPEAVRDVDAYVNQNFCFYQTGEGYGTAKWIDIQRKSERTAAPRIGIVWSGNVTASYNALRAIPIERFAAVFAAAPNAEWHSLQTWPKAKECPAHVINHADELTSFGRTAQIVAELDLVITVDSSVANLCGSMGAPVWVLTERPGESDFRWALTGESTPWFPSARVFRQGNDRKWKRPMRAVAHALAAWGADWDSAGHRIAA